MAPYEAILYDRKYGYSLFVGEKKNQDQNQFNRPSNQLRRIRKRLTIAQDRQKEYTDIKRKEKVFDVREKVLLKVPPWQGAVRLGKRNN